MAPIKEDKEPRLTPEQSADLIKDYLRKQNRPYSATEISANLKNRVTKTAAAKLLKDLHERGEIEGKSAGKAVVYHWLQDDAGAVSLEQLQAMDAETSRLRDETLVLKAEEKGLRATLRDDQARVPLGELKATVAFLQGQESELQSRLAKLRNGVVKPVSPAEKVAVMKEHRKWQKAAAARMKIRVEMWKEIVGVVGKEKMAETKEELGLEF